MEVALLSELEFKQQGWGGGGGGRGGRSEGRGRGGMRALSGCPEDRKRDGGRGVTGAVCVCVGGEECVDGGPVRAGG